MIQQTVHVIAVPDLEKSATYYQEVLGFTIEEIGDPGWRFFRRDNCRIMAGHCPDAIPPEEVGDHSYFAYFVVDAVDQYFTEVSEQGADIIKSLRSEPWEMREFGIQTIDGHRIMMGQPIDVSS